MWFNDQSNKNVLSKWLECTYLPAHVYCTLSAEAKIQCNFLKRKFWLLFNGWIEITFSRLVRLSVLLIVSCSFSETIQLHIEYAFTISEKKMENSNVNQTRANWRCTFQRTLGIQCMENEAKIETVARIRKSQNVLLHNSLVTYRLNGFKLFTSSFD